jgi:hypothetical protein
LHSVTLQARQYSNDLDSAIVLTSEAEKINDKHNKENEAMAYFVYAAAFVKKGNNAAGKAYIESAENI